MQKTDFFKNVEGLNITDSPFFVKDGQATGGFCYDYSSTGGISKVLGPSLLNAVTDAQLKTIGMALLNTSAGVKTVIRAAGTKIQTFEPSSGTFTNIASDSVAASTDFLASGSTQPVVSASFNTANSPLTWLAGGGMSTLYAYTGSAITANGVAAPTGTFTAVNQGSSTGGAWTPTSGTYYWAIALRKRSTQALSNAALDQTATISTATDTVILTFPAGIDTTSYDKWYVYRSSVGGATAFTAGTLVAKVDTTLATYTDTGAALATSQNIPRSGNTILDNSQLTAGTYNCVATFKRHLITAYGSTICISALDLPESWPIGLTIPIPSGGNITSLGVIGYNNPDTGTTDEYLVICKQRETWIITGGLTYNTTTALYDLALKFVDEVGCAAQALMVPCGGFLTWVDYRGIYMWSGVGKPVYCSRPIEAFFSTDGDLDKTQLAVGFGVFFRKKNQVVWTLSHRTKGTNRIQLKLDLRLTIPQMSQSLVSSVTEGVFMMDSFAEPFYGGLSYLPTDLDEAFLVGDASGHIYRMYFSVNDAGAGVAFSYVTKYLDMGQPSISKNFNKIIVYVSQFTTQDLTLDYWAGYRNLISDRSTIAESMGNESTTNASRWDLAVWDEGLWDESNDSVIPLVFNLASSENNREGDSLLLKFSQSDAGVPVIIHGFSVFWSTLAPVKG